MGTQRFQETFGAIFSSCRQNMGIKRYQLSIIILRLDTCFDPNDTIFNVRAEPMVVDCLLEIPLLEVPRGNVLCRLIDILGIDDLGISAIRPGPFRQRRCRSYKVTVIRVCNG